MLQPKPTRAPDLVGTLRHPAPLADLSIYDLDVALDAIGDAEDHAGPDTRARLGRVRGALERELAGKLAA